MNQQNLSLQSSQNDVLSEQPSQESQKSKEISAIYHVEYFCVADYESKYHSPLFATKAQNDVVLQHVRLAFPNAHGEQRKSYFRSKHEAGRQELLAEIVGVGSESDYVIEQIRLCCLRTASSQGELIGEGV
ncbi:hypothetical protein [Methylomonas fluvii]|uniref:Uncharacterized protein n=1 Tax=Methylomonas fluvii TaxID=1854564 RepID=A0ABR9DF89_9GAMM|nr:hypothetical protein [Methylomonas fluvii]MBD9361738.1 hypothetical protein [Methylomonas fluvii]